MIPALEYRYQDGKLAYRWSNVVAGFDMPVDVVSSRGGHVRLRPTDQWQTTRAPGEPGAELQVLPAFYVTVSAVK